MYHYFEHVISKEVKTVYLFSNNCEAQNSLYVLVKRNRFDKNFCLHLELGHSFLACDESSGVVKNIYVK